MPARSLPNRARRQSRPTRIIAFNKPYGVLSQFTAEGATATLATFGFPSDVYPVGRLDRDSEGLLLLSDDGPFIHQLLNPRFGHERVYWVQVEGDPAEDAVARLVEGVILKDGPAHALRARRLLEAPRLPPRNPPVRYRRSIPTVWLELTLGEGRNRQVRRMTAAVGHPTLRLVRISIGRLELGALPPGQWRAVRRDDVV